jgi:hypothetical protein
MLQYLLFLVAFVVAHPTHYKKFTGEGYPPIQSFHVHVLFFQLNQNNTNVSLAFYKVFSFLVQLM